MIKILGKQTYRFILRPLQSKYLMVMVLVVVLVLLGGLGRDYSWKIKKIDIGYQGFDGVSGTVESIGYNGDYEYLTLDQSEAGGDTIAIQPSTKNLSDSLKIMVGDRVVLVKYRTIGDETLSLSVYRNNRKYLMIVQGEIFSIITLVDKRSKTSDSYRVEAGEVINPNPQSPQVESSLLLHYDKNDEVTSVFPGESVALKLNWNFYLVKARRDNPEYTFNPNIAKESAPLSFDYIMYRD